MLSIRGEFNWNWYIETDTDGKCSDGDMNGMIFNYSLVNVDMLIIFQKCHKNECKSMKPMKIVFEEKSSITLLTL